MGSGLSFQAESLALHAGSRRFDSHRGHVYERFFRLNRPRYPLQVSSELENSGIRGAVGDCSVTERRRWRPPYQTGKTVHVHAKNYKHNEDGRTAPVVCGNDSVSLSHSGNVVTRIGIHTQEVVYFWGFYDIKCKLTQYKSKLGLIPQYTSKTSNLLSQILQNFKFVILNSRRSTI